MPNTIQHRQQLLKLAVNSHLKRFDASDFFFAEFAGFLDLTD
jgi:hypothetical protein